MKKQLTPALSQVAQAYEKRRELEKRLSDQNAYIGHLVRLAHSEGHPWTRIAQEGGVSDVAVIKAARRS